MKAAMRAKTVEPTAMPAMVETKRGGVAGVVAGVDVAVEDETGSAVAAVELEAT